MAGVKEAVKKYWPYLLAAGGVGFLLWRSAGQTESVSSAPFFMAGGTGSDGSQLAAIQAQANASKSNDAASVAIAQSNNATQLAIAQGQMALQGDSLNKQFEGGMAELSLQRDALYAQAAIGFQNANTENMKAYGSAYSSILDSLNAPNIEAIKGAAAVNVATQNAAGTVAAASLLSQSNITANQPAANISTTPTPVPSNVVSIKGSRLNEIFGR